jgi:hypothetical protein
MTSKADLAENKPSLNQLTIVSNGEKVTAETENSNNLLMLQALILVYNWIASAAAETNAPATFTALQTFNVNNGINPDIAFGNATSSVPNGNMRIIPNGSGRLYYGTDLTPSNEIARQSYVNSQIQQAATVTGIQMTGATAGDNGVSGAVPTPLASEENYILTGGGTWVDLAVRTETFTNKTINGDDNTLSNIDTPALKTKTGNGANVATSTGSLTSGNLASWDANGNIVDSGANLTSIQSPPVNNQTGTTYTLQASDLGKAVTFDNASAVAVTVPDTLPTDFNCICIQKGAGQVTFTGSGGITIRNSYAHSKTRVQRSVVGLVRDGSTNDIYLTGDTGS